MNGRAEKAFFTLNVAVTILSLIDPDADSK